MADISINLTETPVQIDLELTSVAGSFPQSQIDHTVILNRGANSHDVIDTHITDTDARLDDLEAILEVDVTSISDFPTPVSGVITLNIANRIYMIRGAVDISTNRIVVAATGVKICGRFVIKDSLTSTTTGVLFTATNFNFVLRELTVTSLTATKAFELSGTPGSDHVDITSNILTFGNSLGTISTYKTFEFVRNLIGGFTSGITLSGLFDAILVKINLGESFTGTFLDLGTSTCDAIDIGENAFTLQPSATFLEIATLGANIVSGGEGTIFGNKVNIIAGGTPIVGYSTFEDEWGVDLNDKIKSSDRILPTGWGFYVDGLTSPATQVLTTTPQKLQNDAAGALGNEDHLPNSIKGTGTLWDEVNDLILPITEGDSYDMRLGVNVTAKSGNPNAITFQLDIGGMATPTNVVITVDEAVTKSAPFDVLFAFPFFSLDTFIANKGQIFLSTDTGTATIGDRRLLLVRTSSGVT